MKPTGAGENLIGLRIHRERSCREQEAGAVQKFDERLRALLQARNRGAQLGAFMLVEFGRDSRAPLEIGQGVDQRLEQRVVARRAHIMSVDVLELGEVEA